MTAPSIDPRTPILVGCGQHEESLGTQIDGAVAKVEQGAAQVVESVQDAAITAQIKAEFEVYKKVVEQQKLKLD
mgnify:CR=1 FL=1